MTNGPLIGIRVIDMATDRADMAGRILADLGAEVIKVEPPEGAVSRSLPPFDKNNGESLYWASVALGKKSVVLDIEISSDRARLEQLVATSDVFIESFDPGFLDSHNLGSEQLRALNPRLIYLSVTPYGQFGPDALSPATDLTLEAAGGLLALQGDGDRPPIPVGYPQASFHGGVQGATDVIIALNERAASGLGQHLDLAMQPGIVWTLMNASGYPFNLGMNPPGTCETRAMGTPELMPGVKFSTVYPCKDGHVIASMGVGERGARMLAKILDFADSEGMLPADLRAIPWATWQTELVEGRVDAATVMRGVDAASALFMSKTKKELMAQAVKDDFLLAPFYAIDEVVHDHQLEARDYWTEVDGRLHPGKWALMTRSGVEIPGPAPKLGQHQSLLDSLPTSASPVHHEVQRKGAFEGLKVADFAWVGVGPLIAKALADHGATVVHVESVTRPDVLRLGQPFKDGVPGIDRSQFQANFNTSKLGLALNLVTTEGSDLAHRLIDWADVVVESYTPGTMKKLGLDFETLSATRPDLIMLSTCLRGQTGPERSYAGFGTHGAVLGGFGVITGWPDRAPRGPWGAYTDFIAPRYGVAALASAIFERRSSGLGQYIDLSQVEAAIHFLEPLMLDYTVNGKVPGGSGHGSARSCPHGVYQCAGLERHIAIAIETEAQWRALRAVAHLDAFRSAEFDSTAARMNVRDAIDDAIRTWCAGQDAFTLSRQLKEAGVPASPVLYPADLYEDPQLAERGFFPILEHGVMGPTPYDGLMTIFSDAPAGPHSAGPCLGQHTEYVLREILGVDDEAIAMAAAVGALS